MGYGLLRLFAFRCLAAHSRWTGPSFCGNFDGKMITSMGGDPVLHKAKVDDFQWFPYFEKGSIICRSTSALFWPRAIYKLPAWLFFFLMVFESYNPNVTLGTCTSASWAGSFFVVESFSPGWTDCLRHALWLWCGPQASVEISANGPLGVSMRYFILWHI